MNTYMKGVIEVKCDACSRQHLSEYEVRQESPGTGYGLNTFNRCECGSQCFMEVWRAFNSVTCPFCLGHGVTKVSGSYSTDFCEACDGNGWIERDELEREIRQREKEV